MKYLRTFENKRGPQMGDYVICEEQYFSYDEHKNYFNFLDNNIGIIVNRDSGDGKFFVEYSNIPEEIKSYFKEDITYFDIDEIVEWSDKKKDLELILNTRKYNI